MDFPWIFVRQAFGPIYDKLVSTHSILTHQIRRMLEIGKTALHQFWSCRHDLPVVKSLNPENIARV